MESNPRTNPLAQDSLGHPVQMIIGRCEAAQLSTRSTRYWQLTLSYQDPQIARGDLCTQGAKYPMNRNNGKTQHIVLKFLLDDLSSYYSLDIFIPL
ncbi:hypothetical protein AVEN_264951-1 [Araneus ventricosus]|uniref:Uncharacterized protein n=1 Tax=Araneus ventricosus TaxID=182803 RepID=A0A4Y2MU50_ARAVE|nr:hypothetical protein AVEN_264951-1 [Araneus ventricosus]